MNQGGVAAALIVAGGLLASCSSNNLLGSSGLSNVFGSGSSQSANSAPAPSAPVSSMDYDCPPVQIRPGAAALSIAPPGQEPAANNLRYQVSFGQNSRDCTLRSGNLTMRVGVQGRVVLGPSGAPSTVPVPLRVAIVREGIEPKTILTKFVQITVNLEAGQESTAFTTVFDDLTFPLPPGDDLDAFVVYIGFDPQGTPKPVAKKPAPRKPARGGT